MVTPFRLTVAFLITTTVALWGSGPYSPPHIDPDRDQLYNTGKAIFWGDTKLGTGVSCGECHAKKDALSKTRLVKVKFDLQNRISNCVVSPDRTHGAVDGQQMEALVHYLAKRFRL